MKNYTETYLEKTGQYTEYNDVHINCEICNARASEIHHILNKNRLIEHSILHCKDNIENIMAICRKCHNDYGEDNAFISLLFKIHSTRLDIYGVEHDKEYINKLITYYESIK